MHNLRGNTKQEVEYVHSAMNLIDELQNTTDPQTAWRLSNQIRLHAQEAKKWGNRKVLNNPSAKDPPGPRLVAAADLLTSISNSLYIDIKMKSESRQDDIDSNTIQTGTTPSVIIPAEVEPTTAKPVSYTHLTLPTKA